MSTNRYALWLRVWHWVHGLCFLVEVFSGLALHYADVSSPFLSFRYAVATHNIAGVGLVFLWVCFVVANAVFKGQRHYWPRLKGIYSEGKKLMAYYLVGILRGEPSPFSADTQTRFNPIQRLTYFSVMYGLMPAIAFSGILLLFPEWAPEKVLGAGGVWPMAILHLVVAYLLTLFLMVHIYLGTTGKTPWALFIAMWRGSSPGDVLPNRDGIAYEEEERKIP